jgi:hypothetical protein
MSYSDFVASGPRRYFTHKEYREYLMEYAKKFSLKKKLKEEICKISDNQFSLAHLWRKVITDSEPQEPLDLRIFWLICGYLPVGINLGAKKKKETEKNLQFFIIEQKTSSQTVFSSRRSKQKNVSLQRWCSCRSRF